MRKIVLLVCAVVMIACNKEKVTLTGRISNAEKGVLHLDEVDVYETRPADSVVLKKDGRFNFAFNIKNPGFYQLRLSGDQVIVLFPKPGQRIRITADANRLLSSLEIEGSHDTEQVTKLIRMLNETKRNLDSLTNSYDAAQHDSVRERLNREYLDVLERHRKFSITFILTHHNSLASLYALHQQYQPGDYVFYKTTDMQFFKIVSDSLSKYYPGLKHVTALKAYTDNMIGKYKTQVILHQAGEAEESLPAVALPDMAGDTITLTSLRGKYVLLSFWASYNKTSVAQNLEFKKIYDRYKSRNFEVLQVSFDNSTDSWKKAVRFDELPWISVIDTRYPNSVVAGNFNVTALPANFLIDKDNLTILAKNITPAQLQLKLQELIKN